uniref:SGS domain-containing protein n=1 Tax=Panagrolaimus sp. ES5 TaxID=591445 RepID=A0AC34FEF4_9BILA
MVSQIVKLEYYQTPSNFVINLLEKNVDESKIVVNCKPKHLKVTYGDRILLNTSLFGEVIPEELSYSIKPRKIEISLKKKDSKHWSELEDKHKDEMDAKKRIPTDKWGAVVKEIDEDEAEAKDVDGVLKKLFANCDDDAKKAMMKSWSESGGKVLSMDWNDVKKKKCEYKSENGEDSD